MAKPNVIYRDPLRVICINSRNSTKLIKGATYFATAIHTYQYSSSPKTRRVYLKDVGSYNVDYFTLLDGRPLTNEPDFAVESGKRLDTDNNNYKGQFIRCRYSSGKTLKQGEIYYVEDQKVTTRKGYGTQTYKDVKLKIRGIRNLVNGYRFEEVPVKEQRKIKLNNLKGDSKIKTGEQTRKFLLYTEKERITILFETLTKVLLDLNKVELKEKIDIVKLMLIKGKNYALIEEDIRPFLKDKVNNILKPYDF